MKTFVTNLKYYSMKFIKLIANSLFIATLFLAVYTVLILFAKFLASWAKFIWTL